MPLNEIGIYLARQRYGIFDLNEDLKTIEGGLLEFHDATVAASIFTRPRVQELNQRWHEAYHQRYPEQ